MSKTPQTAFCSRNTRLILSNPSGPAETQPLVQLYSSPPVARGSFFSKTDNSDRSGFSSVQNFVQIFVSFQGRRTGLKQPPAGLSSGGSCIISGIGDASQSLQLSTSAPRSSLACGS